jgi:Domain of unknown function (DUF4148)
MSKLLVRLVIAASAIAAPALSFAQSTGSLTRAEVYQDLVRVEQAGYNPARGDDPNYPADIQAAEAKIATMQQAQQPATQDVGGTAQDGNTTRGARAHTDHSSCIGPVSFCNVFFGS